MAPWADQDVSRLVDAAAGDEDDGFVVDDVGFGFDGATFTDDERRRASDIDYSMSDWDDRGDVLTGAPLLGASDHSASEFESRGRLSSYAPKPAISVETKNTGSTTIQATFNAVNVLVGGAILSLPYAARCGGWAVGSTLLVFFTIVTNYTARILYLIMREDPKRLNSYQSIAQYAFGMPGRVFVSICFATEILAALVTFLILMGDQLNILFPEDGVDPLKSSWFYVAMMKTISFAVVLPTTWLKQLSWLSYASIVGIISSVGLVGVVIFDGFQTTVAPGALLDPAPTEIIAQPMYIPLAFGLIMACFAGHAVFPMIYSDMKDHTKSTRVIGGAYLIAMTCYSVLAVAGYLMYGVYVQQEITTNMQERHSDEVGSIVNHAAVWLLLITPACKFAVSLAPASQIFEEILQRFVSIDKPWKEHVTRITLRTILSIIVLAGAVAITDFSKIMAFLGALFSFTVSVLFPIAAHLKVFNKSLSLWVRVVDILLLAVFLCFAVAGVVWSVLPASVLQIDAFFNGTLVPALPDVFNLTTISTSTLLNATTLATVGPTPAPLS